MAITNTSFTLNKEEFIAFLGVMSYNKQFMTEYDPWQFTVTSLMTNQNSIVAYEVYGKIIGTIELRLRIYCNYGTVNRVEPYLLVETREDNLGVQINIYSAYAILDEQFLSYDNNVVRQEASLIINDPSLLSYFLEEDSPEFVRLEDASYLMDERYT